MIFKTINHIDYLQFPHLAEYGNLNHAITTRHGGTSRPPFDTLNIGENVQDDLNAVRNNRNLLFRAFKAKAGVAVKQVHGDHVRQWTASADQRQNHSPPLIRLGEADALVTSVPDYLLLIQTADCQAIMLFDPVQQVIGNVHSGWRGSILNIAAQAIKVMQEQYSCRPADILAGIGPSLGPCCAEFVNYQKEIPKDLWGYKDSRHHFDFWALTRDQLMTAGLKAANIHNSDLCNCCRSDLFFSYRQAKTTGRFGALIGLIP